MRAAYLILLIVNILFFLWGIYFFFEAQEEIIMMRFNHDLERAQAMSVFFDFDFRTLHLRWLVPVFVFGISQIIISILSFRFLRKGGITVIAILTILFTLLHLLVSWAMYSASHKETVTLDIIFSEFLLLVFIILNAIALGLASRSARPGKAFPIAGPSDVKDIRIG